MLAIDQYGTKHWIPGKHPRKELLAEFDRKHANKMYIDREGKTYHIGYIVAGLWLSLYDQWEKAE